MQLFEIRKMLKSRTDKKTKASWRESVPSAEKVYGVRVSVLNEMFKKIKVADFDLVQRLWRGGVLEERILAAKILGKICKKDPAKTLGLLEKFSKDISDWPSCDTLATQGIRKIAKVKLKEIFKLAQKVILSKNLWQRRFAIVLLVELSGHGFDKKEIEKLAEKVEGDKEHYVKRAIVWLKSSLG